MKQSEAWIFQANSDFTAAKAVYDKATVSTYCQSIAKYQQTVEKSVKGMIAALNEQQITNIPISHNHDLKHEIESLSSLRRAGLKSYEKNLVDQINNTLNKRKTQVEWISSLAPAGSKDKIYLKNTEYPFNDSSPGGWASPADAEVFSDLDVTMAHNLAEKLHKKANNIVTALQRRK